MLCGLVFQDGAVFVVRLGEQGDSAGDGSVDDLLDFVGDFDASGFQGGHNKFGRLSFSLVLVDGRRLIQFLGCVYAYLGEADDAVDDANGRMRGEQRLDGLKGGADRVGQGVGGLNAGANVYALFLGVADTVGRADDGCGAGDDDDESDLHRLHLPQRQGIEFPMCFPS